jgi:hypothetical protein
MANERLLRLKAGAIDETRELFWKAQLSGFKRNLWLLVFAPVSSSPCIMRRRYG